MMCLPFSVWDKTAEIIEISVNEVIKDLNSAYADEWLAHYQYFLYAQVLQGIEAERLKEKLEEQSQDEMNHAKILINRILELGGKPSTDLQHLLHVVFLHPLMIQQTFLLW